jgi:ubiquinone/menaquinone biosynthesis C-methylase UbiE
MVPTMSEKPNAQYNLAGADSLAAQVAAKTRQRMFQDFMKRFSPSQDETVLDIGATSDRTYDASNYFEHLYPHKDRVTASGVDDASFLEAQYPGVKFVFADALNLPFEDNAFDLVHSSAVLEHVGSLENQKRMIIECLRVARRGICLTTPNRWFPIELHTQLPLIHWLPKPTGRALFKKLGYEFFAQESNLNLMSRSEIREIVASINGGWNFDVHSATVLGWQSNLILFAERMLGR